MDVPDGLVTRMLAPEVFPLSPGGLIFSKVMSVSEEKAGINIS